MWMQHRFDHVRAFAAAAESLGFRSIELSHYVEPSMVEGLMPGEVTVCSVHYPAPSVHHPSGALGDRLLAVLDEDARSWAVRQGFRCIDTARAMGAGAVCVHLGRVDMETHLCWALEQRYLAGQGGSPVYETLKSQVLAERAERQAPHLDAARRSLDELAEHAARAGVRLGLENRRHAFEIPTLAELRLLLGEHDPDTVGFWYDTGHAQVLANLGFSGQEQWLEACADRIVGVHFHDSVGGRDHLVPPMGEISFPAIAQRLPADALRVCEFDWYFGREEVRAGRLYLQEVGCLNGSVHKSVEGLSERAE
jgi:sugar phosphate isomerase/epimerase